MEFYEFDPDTNLDPAEMVIACIERGAESILLDESTTPGEFFDLSSGLLGELLHKMSMYRMRLAIIIADPKIYSENFQSFLREANKGDSIRSFTSRQEAVKWLLNTP